MRTGFTTAAALVIALGFMAQAVRADEKEIPLDKVPKAVMKTVKDKYPKAQIKTAIEETEDGKTTYEIETTLDGMGLDLVLKPDGTLMVAEKEIKEKDLPAAVSAAVKAKYPSAKVKKAEELTEGDTVTYELALEGAGDIKEVVLDKTGKFLKEEKD